MRKEVSKSFFMATALRLLCLMLFAKGDPICYTREFLDEDNVGDSKPRTVSFKRVNCDDADNVFKRFSSRKEVNLADMMNSPCEFPEDHSVPNQDKEAIECRKDHLPAITDGFFNCSGYTVGDKCELTCDDGFYASSSKETVCEENGDFQGNWSVGIFLCSEITCLEKDLPEQSSGHYTCPSEPIREGRVCNLTCNVDFHPLPSNQVVCVATETENGGEWFPGNISCSQVVCIVWNEWNASEYKVMNTHRNWYEADQMCENDGAHLVTIENQEENNFVRNLAKTCCERGPWIGLNDIETKGVWQWSDGALATYRNWANVTVTEDCAIIYKSNGKWHDNKCNSLRPAVCERSKPT